MTIPKVYAFGDKKVIAPMCCYLQRNGACSWWNIHFYKQMLNNGKMQVFLYSAIQLAFLSFFPTTFLKEKLIFVEDWDGPNCCSSAISGSLPSETYQDGTSWPLLGGTTCSAIANEQ